MFDYDYCSLNCFPAQGALVSNLVYPARISFFKRLDNMKSYIR